MKTYSRRLRALLLSAVGLIALAPISQAVTIQSSTIATGTFALGADVNYDVVLEGTSETVATDYPYIVYVKGSDFYGNTVYIEVARGTASGLRGEIPNPGGTPTKATTFRIQGSWKVPTDGTLHHTGYEMIVAVYNTYPTTLTELTTTVISASAAPINVDVTPDMAILSPGATYPAGSYRGKDIIRFTGSWINGGGATPGGRPLDGGSAGDLYTYNLRLTTDPEFRTDAQTNDDFQFLYWALGGDIRILPNGTSEIRKIVVTNTPGQLEKYGIAGLPAGKPPVGTERIYFPQPYDGFLDIGEVVQLTSEVLIPENYSGRYFVAARVEMEDANLDSDTNNNVFVSNAANKIEILETASPTVEAASAVSKENGDFVQGGDAASDFGSVSESGDIIAFASRASNLLASPAGGSYAVTAGQQIFLKFRQTREVFLASRTSTSQQANADCFNPMVSANGRYVAYDSQAVNLVSDNTGGRSMIYVFDSQTGLTVNVSKNASGVAGNGSSYNPSISESGRFVAFESLATNLDLPQFTTSLSSGGISSTFTKVRGGAGGYNAAAPPAVTFSGGGGSGAAATATVGANGTITGLVRTSAGSGYTSAPTITIAPPPAAAGQVFVHDRDTDGDGIFDEPGYIATYLASVNSAGAVANALSFAPAIALDDSNEDIAANGGIYLAFVSYAAGSGRGAMPSGTGNAMVYRTLINVSGAALNRGPVLSSVTAVSVNDIGEAPPPSPELVALGQNPDSYEPAINGDGSQVAFTSWGSNLVYNSSTGLFDADTNGVQDIFVRNFRSAPPTTVRVSISQERVATGTIWFSGTTTDNVPDNQPSIGDTITISDGVTSKVFTFAATGGDNNVPVGANVQESRDNLVAVINAASEPGAPFNIIAEATTPPNAAPGTGYFPGIYLKNTVPGEVGNVDIETTGSTLVASGMAGGGTQANDAPAAVQGVPFGSNQPSIDRSGRFVAFRSIAESLDVHIATDANNYPSSPITGELIRPLIFPTSNVYLHDRLADGDESRDFDLADNYTTSRVSLNKFGYPTLIFGTEPTGIDSTTSANSSSPALSANGRFVAFSSDSEGMGGLVFGLNNLTPLDNTKFRDVFVYDRSMVGDNPPRPTTAPTVTIISPPDGLIVTPGTQIPITADARATLDKTIVSVELFVNNVSEGVLTSVPFAWNYTAYTSGTYVFRVVATDSKGMTQSSSVTLTAENPGSGAPVVFVTQPLSDSSSSVTLSNTTVTKNFVTGSKFFINASAVATAPATINSNGVRFTANGITINDSVGKLGDTYGVLYMPSSVDAVDTLRAEARDTYVTTNYPVGRLGFSPPLFTRLGVIQTMPPKIDVVPITPAQPINSAQNVTLQAEAVFPDPEDDRNQVEFYVNKVYVGKGSAVATNTTGSVIYSYNWQTPNIVSSNSGPERYDVYARAVAWNYTTWWWWWNSAWVYAPDYYSSVVSGPTPMDVYYVPTNPAAGSNPRFVIDYFQKIYFRNPTYDEYSQYLDMLQGGFTQADIVMDMFNAPSFSANEGVLFGYYLRMGLKPTGTNQLANYLATMTNVTGLVPLPSTMSAGVATPPALTASPYGATVGQSKVAQALINTIANPWQGNSIKNLTDQNFMGWMLRSFNEPYLPQTFPTNQSVAWAGNQASILNTISTYTNPVTEKFGASYAFMSALYAAMPPTNVSSTNLRTTLTNFGPLVQGIAATYLLSQSNTWATNAGPINTNMISRLLPPYITNSGTNAIPVNAPYSNAIGGQNLFSNTVYYASNLPSGLGITNGAIQGTPTVATNYTSIIFASNGPGLVGSNSIVFEVLSPAPSMASATFTSIVGQSFAAVLTASNAPTNFVVGAQAPLPPGLSLNPTNGVISGTPTTAGTTTNLITAFNRSGYGSAKVVFKLEPAFAAYLAKYSLAGADAEPGADPDKDGYSNVQEFAFGMDPSRPSGQPYSITKSGNSLTITWTRRINTLITYSVQSTPELSGAWSSVSPQPTAQKLSDVDADYERVSATVTVSGDSQFYRVHAILPAGVF